MLHSLMVSLHLLAAVIWVGGMFFAYMMVRPAMAALQPPEPVRMWGRIFTKFFSWVWIAVRSEEHTSELQSPCNPRMPSSA